MKRGEKIKGVATHHFGMKSNNRIRPCLKCGNPMVSSDFGNRHCDNCRYWLSEEGEPIYHTMAIPGRKKMMTEE
jgi:hypothetical protein